MRLLDASACEFRGRYLGVVFFLLASLMGCATESKWPGVGAMHSGPSVGCPPIMSPYGDYRANYGKRRRAVIASNLAIDHPHSGVDIEVPVGTAVLAAAPGTISGIRWNTQWLNSESLGTRMVVYHGKDLDGLHVFTTYLHLSKRVKEPGEKVERGEAIALSGEGTNVPHLHFGLWRLPVGPRFDGAVPLQGPAMQGHFDAAIEGRQQSLIYSDPALFWLNPKNPSYVATSEYPALPIRLTYPVACNRK